MPSEAYFVRLVSLNDTVSEEIKVTSGTGFEGPEKAAEFFASEVVDQEMFDERRTEEHMGSWHGVTYTIDVRHPDETEWRRFSVVCKCKFEFESRQI